MNNLSDFIQENMNTKISFNLSKHSIDKVYNDVDAYDAGIDFELDIKNNKVVSIRFKSEDIEEWKEITE